MKKLQFCENSKKNYFFWGGGGSVDVNEELKL